MHGLSGNDAAAAAGWDKELLLLLRR